MRLELAVYLKRVNGQRRKRREELITDALKNINIYKAASQVSILPFLVLKRFPVFLHYSGPT